MTTKARLAILALALMALSCDRIGDQVERVVKDPSRLCPPNHVLQPDLTCVERPSAIVEPSPSPEPPPTATPAPTPDSPGPTPTPAAPEPEVTPTPAAPPPTPVPTATPRPTPKPTPSACARDCAWRLEADQRHGHLVRTPSGLYCDDASGTPPCFNAACEHVTPQGGVLHSACDWMGLEACCAQPEPQPTVTPPPGPGPTPGPTPGATPATCPKLVRWGLAPEPFIGTCEAGACLFDTTPRFERWPGDTRGGPCNGEHDNCGGRRCEDPRGLDPSGVTVRGGGEWRLIDDGYKVKVQGSAPPQSITVCPRGDLQDAEGRPVQVVGDGCDTKEYR